MNDLAVHSLEWLQAARRHLVSHAMACYGVLGAAITVVVMVSGGRVNAAQPTRPISTWFGLQDTNGARPGDRGPAILMFVSILVLVVLWMIVVAYVRRHDVPDRRLWLLAGAWAAPLLIGPPLMDTTVQSYVAFGMLQRHGLSPYSFPPSRLGTDAVVGAIEPSGRGTPSSTGPLGSLVQHLAVSASAGNALAAIIILRAVAVAAAVLIGRLAADLAGGWRARALSLTILNPLLLLFVVSAAHLDGLMVALVLAAVAAGGQRRWLAAIVLACVAGSVDGPAFVAVPAIVAAHWLGRRSISPFLLIGRDVLVAAVTTAVSGLIVGDGFGWLRTVTNQFSAHTPYSVAGAIAKLLDPVVRGASYDDLATGARITTVAAMVCVVVYLLVTARQRALERTVGYALLAVALLAPVLFPWYLLWGTLCLAPTASGSRRGVVVALCAAGCVLAPPGFTTLTANVLTGVSLGVIASIVVPLLRRRGRRVRVTV
jgi:hypothetical protein